MRVCGMLHYFFMLWEQDLATDVDGNLDKWTEKTDDDDSI